MNLNFYFNYSEKNTLIYSIEEAVKWFQDNRPNKKGDYKGCLFKDIDAVDDIYILYHFFLHNGTPIVDGSMPLFVTYTNSLSEVLIYQFGEHALIVFK